MREIKFRAWDNIQEEMFYNVQTGIYEDPDEIIDFENILSLARYEVMQYTGQKDKNGVEIYEGDILEICGWEGEFYKVYYEDTAFRTKALFKETSCCSREKVLSDLLECKIIGNIYQNSELLKEG